MGESKGAGDGAGSEVAPRVSVSLAGESQRRLIDALAQFYIYDFSEMEPAGSVDFEVDEQGGFGDLPGVGAYWREADCHVLLIRVNERPAGFALINAHSHRDGGHIERNMGEFFVMRKHRGRGAAAEAVRQVLQLYPGRWEIAVAERNAAAKTFWPRAIAAAPNVSELTRIEGDGHHWRGPIWTFVAS
jgi:predicted acetyltransferase